MNKIFLAIILVAFLLVIIVTILYGPTALLLPFFLASSFLVAFAAMAWNAEIQMDANPGIEEIEEPNFWFSDIYNAWLYATDLESWALFAAIISLIASAFFGSLFGVIFRLIAHTAPSGTIESWLAGMFFTVSIAINVVSADYWARQSKMRHKVFTSPAEENEISVGNTEKE